MIRVLLADDSPHAQRMGKEILSQEGFEVLGVTDGQQAADALGSFAPDLVLADVCMPGQSGYQICEQIKTDPALGRVKVLLLVGALEPFDPAEADRVGADGVLHKPLEPSLVVETIQKLLQGPIAPPDRAPTEKDREVLEPAPTTAPLHPRLGAGPGHEDFALAVQQALKDSDPDRGVEREQVRAAVVLALESALPALSDELTERVVVALRQTKP